MVTSVNLGDHLEGFVAELVKSGRYKSRSEVLREGVRILHKREAQLAALDRSIVRGVADLREGRVYTVEELRKSLGIK